jgi:hypothetical protein
MADERLPGQLIRVADDLFFGRRVYAAERKRDHERHRKEDQAEADQIVMLFHFAAASLFLIIRIF